MALGLLTAACTSTVAGHGTLHAACAPVFFGVAGSGQGPQNPPPANVPAGVSQADADRYGTTVGLLKTELTRMAGHRLASAAAIDYPAIPVDEYIGAAGLSGTLDVSETLGVRRLVAAIRVSYRGGCNGRPVLLAGYSQGAEVVTRAVDRLTSLQQSGVTVALLGNPSHLPHLPGNYPASSAASGIRPAFESGAYRLPPAVRMHTIDICAAGDPVCGVDPSLKTFFGKIDYVLSHAKIHGEAYAFGSQGYTRVGAQYLWRHRS